MKSELEGLMMAMAAANGGNRADNIKFETEDECLAYCKRLAALKPGDEVSVKAEGKPAMRCVFFGPTEGCKRASVRYMGGDNEIGGGEYPWSCIRFPE